jgi:NhaA family Na+:H+ antiporter
VKFIVDRFLLLPIGAAVALVWANIAGESYFRMAHALAFPVNEIGMALFLGLIAQELVDAVLPGGALHSVRRWSMAVIAALGGIVGAGIAYLGYVQFRHEAVLASAWPVVCAIDIAAGYYVLKLLMPRSAAIPFLLLVAAATNLFALLIVALRPGAPAIHPAGPVFIALALAGAAWVRLSYQRPSRRASRASLPLDFHLAVLALCGVISWVGFYLTGLHPALSLVPLALFLPHEPRRDVFADPPEDDDVHYFEHRWNGVVQVVLFLFGLVNAGVPLRGWDAGTWAVLIAVLVGRPVGILTAVGLAEAAGLPLPSRIAWRQIFVVALASSSGFTFALFFASSLLPVGGVLTQIKLGALASVAGAGLAIVAGRILLGPPRRALPHRPRVFASSGRV